MILRNSSALTNYDTIRGPFEQTLSRVISCYHATQRPSSNNASSLAAFSAFRGPSGTRRRAATLPSYLVIVWGDFAFILSLRPVRQVDLTPFTRDLVCCFVTKFGYWESRRTPNKISSEKFNATLSNGIRLTREIKRASRVSRRGRSVREQALNPSPSSRLPL